MPPNSRNQHSSFVTDVLHRATQASGGVVGVAVLRDPCDGQERYAVRYRARGTEWLSPVVFETRDQCEAGVLILSQFMGAARE